MKSFVFSLILIFLIFFVICLNAYFMERKISSLYDSLCAVSMDDVSFSSANNGEKIETLCENWEKARSIMQLFFRRDLIQDFDNSVIAIKSFAKSRDFGDYLFSLESSFDLLDEMNRNNNFDLSVLF